MFVKQTKNMQYISSSKDVFFPFSGTMRYSIVYEGQPIYEGTAVSDGEGKINVTRRIRDYLETNMPDFRDYEGVVVGHPRQMLVFALRGSDGTNLETYTVLQEATEKWSGEYGPITEPINGRADYRQKIFWDTVGEYIAQNWIKGSSESGVTPDTGTTPDTGVSGDYLTFDILSGGTIVWTGHTGGQTEGTSLWYSKDNGVTWGELGKRDYFNVEAGDRIIFRAESYNGHPNYHFTNSTAHFDVSGNIMSIVYGDSFSGNTIVPQGAFSWLFNGTNVHNAGDLTLPSKILSNSCYYSMFRDCRYLATAPSLPATTLATDCYDSMFQGCRALQYAPVLPATTLADGCYIDMFYDSGLRSAPSLPATTLAEGCYNSMFGACGSLLYAPELPATTLARACYMGMFSYCTSLTTAPDLNARDVPYGAYELMFQESGVNHIKCLGLSFDNRATFGWVSGLGSQGTFIKAASATWETGINGIPDGWEVQDA